MYKIVTNFGESYVKIHPELQDIARYAIKAKRAGIAVTAIKFQIVALNLISGSCKNTLSF